MKILDEELRKLKSLYDDGIITKDEFEQKKLELLNYNNKTNNESKNLSKHSINEVKNAQIRSNIHTNNIKNKKDNKNKGCFKIGCASIIIIFILLSIIGSISENYNNKNNTKDTPNKTTTQNKEKTPTKDELKEFDNRSWKDFKDIFAKHNAVMKAMQNSSDMNNYQFIKDSEDYFMRKSVEFNYAKTKEQETYLNPLQIMCISSQSACKNALKYLDSYKQSDLSKTTENIKKSTEAAKLYAANRGILMKQIGYSNEEIKSSLSELDQLE